MEKTDIIEATLELARTKGWEKVSVRDIAKKINYSTIKIYSDFGNKELLLREIQQEGFRLLKKNYLEAVEQETKAEEKLIRLSLAHYHFAREQQVFYDLMFQLNGASCRLPDGNMLSSTSEPVRLLLKQLHGQVDKTLFYNWWALLHGFVTIPATYQPATTAEAEEMLQVMVERFIQSIKQ